MTEEFEHAGLTCEVILTGMGHHCGYVAVPIDHPWYGKSYDEAVVVPEAVLNRPMLGENVGYINLFCAALSADDIERGMMRIDLAIDVHGGLTFSDKDNARDLWWFGFDCAHCDDGRNAQDPNWRDRAYTEVQVRRLADQLAALAKVPA